MTVRAYVRVSTAAQTEKFSLPAQRGKAEAWANYQGLSPVQHYEDGGISGKRDDRPALLMLLDDIEPGDTVLVYSLSRLGRGGVLQLLGTIKEIEDRGGRLVSLTESIDTKTPTGRLLLTILAALAEMEVEQTRERSLVGKAQAAAQGVWPHAWTSLPLGYTKNEEGRIQVHDGEAESVRRIMALSGEGMSCENIAQALNQCQAEKRTKAMWSAQHVHDIRRKRYDLPHIIFRSADGNQIPVPARPLVTAAEWTAAQRNQGRSGRYRTPEEYVLTGHLRCACGSRMQGSKSIYVRQDGTQRRFYVCKRRRGEVCPVHLVKAKTWPLDTIDAQAKVALASALRNPEVMGNLMGSSQPEPVHPEWAEEMDRLKRKQAALLDLYLEEAITRTDFDTRQAALKRRIGELEHMQIPRSRVAIDEAAAQRYAEAAERAGGARLAELLDVLNAEFTVKKSGEVILSRLSIPQ